MMYATSTLIPLKDSALLEYGNDFKDLFIGPGAMV